MARSRASLSSAGAETIPLLWFGPWAQELIRLQATAIAELSTPLIPITDHVVVMPLIGVLDTTRAQQAMDTLLQGLSSSGATVDITGVKVVDTKVADALIRPGARDAGLTERDAEAPRAARLPAA